MKEAIRKLDERPLLRIPVLFALSLVFMLAA